MVNQAVRDDRCNSGIPEKTGPLYYGLHPLRLIINRIMYMLKWFTHEMTVLALEIALNLHII